MNRIVASKMQVAVFLLALVLLTSCETGFEALNTDPTQANAIPPDYLFTTIQLSTAGTRFEQWRSNLIYPEAMIQHMSNTWWAGDKYLISGDENWRTALWLVAYNGNGDGNRAYIKLLQDLIASNQDDPRAVNKIAAARIMRVFAFHRVTDMFGDIPYFEGGKGFLNDDISPRFDPQSEIYADMLNELAEAAASFDPAMPTFGSADLMYGGDIAQWQKFAYSLMLRLGLRLVKVDPGMAQQWVQRAINGGVMTSNADIAYVQHQSGPNIGPNGLNSNGVGDVFEVDQPMLTEFMVNWMKDSGDPRLPIFGALYDGPANNTASQILSTDPADLVGWPVGNDATTIQNHPSYDPTKSSIYAIYAQPNRIIRALDEPTLLLTYAEVEFMLAEAAVRTWHGGDPATHYANGVRAAMEHVALYDAEGQATIPDAAIDAYLAANPYDPARALEQISTQYWAAVFLNGFEAWANWRRTGYPVLEPANFPGNPTQGQIPRRMTYPTSEQILNPENYQEAITRQGPDNFLTRVWWDAP